MNATRTPKCCSQVIGRNFCQETYETASGDARRRAAEIRKANLPYRVSVSSMGPQVTPLGTLRLTMVDIRPLWNGDFSDLPLVDKVEWPR